MLKNNTKNNYKGYVRSTSNVLTATNQYQVNLPPHIWKKMKWKLNENIRIVINKETDTLELKKETSND
jgi:hypothetical protein